MALDPVTTVLTRELDRDLRTQVLRRHAGMLREMRFLTEREDRRLISAISLGWTHERLEVLCGLNAFYQLVLGPLASSARDRTGVLGPETPILYGETLRFDAERSARIRRAHGTFFGMIADLPGAERLMTAPLFSDLVFRLTQQVGSDDIG